MRRRRNPATRADAACTGWLRRATPVLRAGVVLGAAVVVAACTAAGSAPPMAAAPTAWPSDRPAVPAVLRPADVAAFGDLRLVDFGAFPRNERAVTLHLRLDARDVSALVVLTGAHPSAPVGVTAVVGPGGSEVLLGRAPAGTGAAASEIAGDAPVLDAGSVALLLPPAPTGHLAAGTSRLEVVAPAGLAAAQALVRVGPVDGEQVLDVDVWSAAHDLAVDDPAAHAAVGDALRSWTARTLAPHGIALGEVRVVAAGREDRDRVARLDRRDEGAPGGGALGAACARAAATFGLRRAARVVLVDEIVGTPPEDAGAVLAGMAAASPGAALVGPPSRSCAAVALQGRRAASEEVATTALHELAHLLGLVGHTTERAGRRFDRFDDTPACAAERYDEDRDGDVDGRECAAVDASNLMFWTGGGWELSTAQARALRRHPLVRPAGPREG